MKLALLLLAIIPTFGQANDKQAALAKLTDTQVMFTSDTINNASLSECQPLKGEVVEMGETSKRSGALELVKVRVTEGRCENQEGWIGLVRLEKTTD